MEQTKIWVCDICKSVFHSRWLLARHLKQVEKLPSEGANLEAQFSEWWRVYNPNLKNIKS